MSQMGTFSKESVIWGCGWREGRCKVSFKKDTRWVLHDFLQLLLIGVEEERSYVFCVCEW